MKNLFTRIKDDLDDQPEYGSDYEMGLYNVYEELAGDMQAQRARHHAHADDVHQLAGFSHVRAHGKKGNAHERHFSHQLHLL